jgi:glucose-1-phosphate thymidylyltransferase
MDDILTANALVLDELKYTVQGSVDAASIIGRRVTIEPGAEIINSQVRGPSIIGANTRIVNSYIGPYTSVYHDVVIENSELEHSIVLEHSRIENVATRIQDSVIGRNAHVTQSVRKPKSINLNLGDYSQIDLV